MLKLTKEGRIKWLCVFVQVGFKVTFGNDEFLKREKKKKKEIGEEGEREMKKQEAALTLSKS